MDRDARITTRNVERGGARDAGLDPDIERDIGVSDEQDGSLAARDSLREVERDVRDKVYPAPMAGVEPVVGREIDPAGEGLSVEDAELKERADGQAAEPTMELSMTAARLGGSAGLGLLREIRAADGDVAQVPGSWRPEGEADDLPSGLATGRTLRFEGPLHRADGSVQHVVSDVDITSVGD